MNFSRIINFPLGLLGVKLVKKSSLEKLRLLYEHKKEEGAGSAADIERDKSFLKIYEQVKEFTLVEIERCYALYQSVLYLLRAGIPGDFAECGVWKGGSCMLIAFLLKEKGITDRRIWLYDTFEGMTRPGEQDGMEEKLIWEERRVGEDRSNWCRADEEEVRRNLESTGFPASQLRFIKGKVEETLPANRPDSIALLRLDTDWYVSTSHELKHLYPLLEKGGVLLIDDYGAWTGARKATDEFFAGNAQIFLHRIDFTGRLVIK